MNDYLKRLIASNQLEFKNGKIYINSIPMIMQTASMYAYLYKTCEQIQDNKSLFYWCGFSQGFMATQFCMQTYNYKDPASSFKMIIGQSDMLGFGESKIIRLDFKKVDIIYQIKSTISEEYVKLFGKAKEPIDYWYRGEVAGIISVLCNVKKTDLFGYETKCVAKGDSFCEIRVQLNKDIKDNTIIKNQYVKEMTLPFEYNSTNNKKSLLREIKK